MLVIREGGSVAQRVEWLMQRIWKSRHLRHDLFLPWFLSKDLLKRINALLPYAYHKRLRSYFDKYGCIRCGHKNALYCCNGLCVHCVGLISDRLKRGDTYMEKKRRAMPVAPSEAYLKRRASARELLRDLRQRIKVNRTEAI
jgi:hypothetical protein